MKKSNLTKLIAATFIGLSGATLVSQLDNNQASVEAATQPSVVRIKTEGASIRLRSQASYDSSLTSLSLENGTDWRVVSVEKDAAGNTWYNLGNNEWINANYVITDPQPDVQSPSSQIQAVIDQAKSQIGKPYVWGGKGPYGFDCSGLMYYAFMNGANKNIGGWTVPQESAGQQVSLNDLKPGDLVFWGSRGATYHVGLYLGDNQYIHAPQPGQNVQIQSISSYFMPSFGVRVL